MTCHDTHTHWHSCSCKPFEWIRIEWIRIGGIRVEWICIGGIRIGGICFEWICQKNLLMQTFWMDTHWMDTYWWDTCWTDKYCRIRIGGIRFDWKCVGYVWCDGYVWDMSAARYANHLLKHPATNRLSGKKQPKSWQELQLKDWQLQPMIITLEIQGLKSAADCLARSRPIQTYNNECHSKTQGDATGLRP